MLERRVIAVEGVVQGVGFRPYVHRLAATHALRGSVRNDVNGVVIDVEGEGAQVDEFLRTLFVAPPALAQIGHFQVSTLLPGSTDGFHIVPSGVGAPDKPAAIPVDVATCDACHAELFDPANRRFGHPFITCTDCGPRFTIVNHVPFDRERTTMSPFAPCSRCQREYNDSGDRRFHAETICCSDCGPVLSAGSAAAHVPAVSGPAALGVAVTALAGGQIVALKALGGFHLACDATNPVAVDRLRLRKHRPAKPFAIMVRDTAAAAMLAHLSAAERAALESSARPIVLLRRRAEAALAPSVAPGNSLLGLMLASTPLHHLLLAAVNRPLVMTSGNRTGEPVATDEASARVALSDVADLFLTHDRDITARCDDSVVHEAATAVRQIRRSRGYVPRAIGLPFASPSPVLAVGGHLKNTICVVRGEAAHLSAHVGDLDSPASRAALRAAVEATVRTAGAQPAIIARDLHPEYGSSRFAEAYAVEQGIAQRISVQHHHAHVAACLAEHGVREPVIGVVFDGAGLGTDGAIWGGEFLVVDGARYTRSGHLAYVPLPGGDGAARRPWRAAAAHVSRLGLCVQQRDRLRPATVDAREWDDVHALMASAAPVPWTSSVGRLFDAVASLLGVCHVASFEGEAAMALESLAGGQTVRGYPVELSGGVAWTADAAPIMHGVLRDLSNGRCVAEIAGAFHATLCDLIVMGCERTREDTGLETVVLSGGVFTNQLLLESANSALRSHRFHVLLPRDVPGNDGGLALGQAYVAACALEEDLCA